MLTNPDYKKEAYDNLVKHIATLKMLAGNICTYTYCGECPLNIKDGDGCMFSKIQGFIDAVPELRTKIHAIEKQPKHSKRIKEDNNDKTR